MTDKDQSVRPSEARSWTLLTDVTIEGHRYFVVTGLMLKPHEQVEVIERNAYDQLRAQLTEANRRLEIAREGLIGLADDAKHYFGLVGSDINLGNPYSQGRYDCFKWVEQCVSETLAQISAEGQDIL